MANVYNKPIVVVGGGGAEAHVDNGVIYEGKYRVRYIDIDGTVLKTEYVENGGRTTPPNNPSYDPDYLIFDEWNYDIENYIVEQPTDVGAIYNTIDNETYLFCRFTEKTGLNPTLAISGFTSIDWGDGSVDTNTSHTYAKEGEYLIKINGNFSFTTKNSSEYLFGSEILNNTILKVYFGHNVQQFAESMFISSRCLTLISLPKQLTTIKTQFCYLCAIRHLNVPKNVISITGSMIIYNCYYLKSISLPQNIDLENAESMLKNNFLCDLIIPKGVKKIAGAFYDSDENLNAANIYLPQSITNIANYAFTIRGTLNIFICSTNVPTIKSSSFGSASQVGTGVIMWVNDDIIENLKVATNWKNYATYMKPLSWYPSLTDPNA